MNSINHQFAMNRIYVGAMVCCYIVTNWMCVFFSVLSLKEENISTWNDIVHSFNDSFICLLFNNVNFHGDHYFIQSGPILSKHYTYKHTHIFTSHLYTTSDCIRYGLHMTTHMHIHFNVILFCIFYNQNWIKWRLCYSNLLLKSNRAVVGMREGEIDTRRKIKTNAIYRFIILLIQFCFKWHTIIFHLNPCELQKLSLSLPLSVVLSIYLCQFVSLSFTHISMRIIRQLVEMDKMTIKMANDKKKNES